MTISGSYALAFKDTTSINKIAFRKSSMSTLTMFKADSSTTEDLLDITYNLDSLNLASTRTIKVNNSKVITENDLANYALKTDIPEVPFR